MMSDNTLCKYCRSIPWDSLLPSAVPWGAGILKFSDRGSAPSGEYCRTCRFVREVKAIHSLDYNSWGCGPPKPHRMDRGDITARVSIGKPNRGDPHFITTGLAKGDAQVVLRHLYPSTIDTHLVRRWIIECEAGHAGLCKLQDSQPLRNLKVIDCRERKVIAAPENCDYVALSYVWGSTGAEDAGSYVLHGSVLPPTIEDSITFTLSLGYQYLWIDRYCIDQNNAAEKQEQIMQMAQVYETAQLTLIATAGQDPSHGLPGVRAETRQMPCEQVGSVLLIPFPEDSPMYDISDSKWASRAWTYQECYFSRRRLFFLDRQVVFVCNCSTGNETDTQLRPFSAGASFQPHSGWFPVNLTSDNTLAMPSNISSSTSSYSNFIWRSEKMIQGMTTIAQYTKRTLTHQSDAFKAIAGALNTLARYGFRHVWGLPFGLIPSNSEEDFYLERYEIALAWYHASPCVRRTGFPSWSPLGWIGPISWYQERYIGDMARKSTVENLVTVQATGIDLVTEKGCLPLSGYVQVDMDHADLAQGLLINSQTAPLTLVKLPKFEVAGWTTRSVHDYGVALQVDGRREALLKPFWDRVPDPSGTISLKGLLLLGANHQHTDLGDSRPRNKSAQATLMIMELCGEHYERIGVVELSSDADDKTAVAFRSVNIQAGAAPDVREAARPGSEHTVWEVDHQVHASRWWWRNAFATDTVFLK